jgi:hypothetical protein
VDGEEGKQFDSVGIDSIVFSPDGQHLAYPGIVAIDTQSEEHQHLPDEQEGEWYIVLDGKEEGPYGGIAASSVFISPDSQTLAYIAYSSAKFFVVWGGRQGEGYEGIGEGTLVFSPDSKWIAYVAKLGDKFTVVVGEERGNLYDGIINKWGGEIVFKSPDTLSYIAVKDGSVYLIEETITEKPVAEVIEE